MTPDQADAFAAAFGTLGKFHRCAPDAVALAAFRELLAEWPLPDTADARRGLAALGRCASSGEDAGRIAADHNRIYGDAARALVAPYESVFRGTEGLVFGAATLTVRAAYRQFGLQAPHVNREPDDHIGLEFDFVAQLLLRAMDETATGDEDRAGQTLDGARAFVQDHLCQWAPELFHRVAAVAETQFMAGIALLSSGALESLVDALG